VSQCVDGFHADSCHNRAPFVVIVVVALFMVGYRVLFTFSKVFKLLWSDVWFRFNKCLVYVY